MEARVKKTDNDLKLHEGINLLLQEDYEQIRM
jgi:hypothetical protein